ncbi:hypothetical protein [uncultured Pelagimonas sp.]|uniref:hypothetical protein n=1 Tax=uncultured Pelagimonas sp. TaxID=1618102 RepID=UPI002632E04E|nr:hypothetical protein [uncultured Pelagimonas sp.]
MPITPAQIALRINHRIGRNRAAGFALRGLPAVLPLFGDVFFAAIITFYTAHTPDSKPEKRGTPQTRGALSRTE